MALYTDIGNTREIMLYGSIGETVDGNDIGEIIRQAPEANISEIHIRINSNGGDIINGLSVITSLIAVTIPVTTFIDGVAASMAGVIYLTGKKRVMNDFALLMLHEPSFWGMTAEEVEDEKTREALLRFRDMLIKIISNSTKMEEDEVLKVLQQETWYNAEEALKLGLVDEIYVTNFQDLFNQPASKILTKIAAKFKEQTIMEELKNILTLLGMPEGSTIGDIETSVQKLIDEVANQKGQIDTLTTTNESLTAMATLKPEAEEALNDEIKRLSDEKNQLSFSAGEALIAEAKLSGKLTIADTLTLKGKPFSEITTVIAGKVIPKKISAILQSPEDVASLAKEWDTLHHGKNGELGQLKKSNPERFKALFKAKYGHDPNTI